MRKNRSRLREYPRLLSRIAHEKGLRSQRPEPFSMLKNITQNPSSVGAVYGSQSLEGSDEMLRSPESRRADETLRFPESRRV